MLPGQLVTLRVLLLPVCSHGDLCRPCDVAISVPVCAEPCPFPEAHMYTSTCLWAASLWLHSQHLSGIVAKPKSWVFSALSPVFSVFINNTTVKAGNLEVIILNSFLYLTAYISSVRQCY